MVSPGALADALSRWTLTEIPALPGRTNHKRAGVLVPVTWDADGPTVIATVRASHLREHPGEVAFPGGKPEPADSDLTATALREAAEELGLDPASARVLGVLSAMPLFTSDYRLVPTVAAVPDIPWTPDPTEVAAVLRIPLQPLLDAPVLDAVPWSWDDKEHHSPVFPLGDVVMYGATAHTLHELLEVLARMLHRPLPPWRTGRFQWGGHGVVPVTDAG